jgi:hypothetical protein
VIEFTNDEIETLQLGYKWVDYKLGLYAVPRDREKAAK